MEAVMKAVAIFFCICCLSLIAAEGLAGDKQIVQFADTNLERVVRQALNLSATNPIYDVDVAGITNLNASSASISNTVGIEALTGLQYLLLNENSSTNLNVSACTKLQSLLCEKNELANLNVSGCTTLRILSCTNNQLMSLNVSACLNLHCLLCSDNRLTNLSVSGCTNLQALICFNNRLKNLDVSAFNDLQYADCNGNQLTVLNISSNTALNDVYAAKNPLTNIVVWWTPPTSNNIPSTIKLFYNGNPTFSNPKWQGGNSFRGQFTAELG